MNREKLIDNILTAFMLFRDLLHSRCNILCHRPLCAFRKVSDDETFELGCNFIDWLGVLLSDFLIVAIKRLIEFLSVNTVLSVLGALLLSTILGGTLMLLIIQNESGNREKTMKTKPTEIYSTHDWWKQTGRKNSC